MSSKPQATKGWLALKSEWEAAAISTARHRNFFGWLTGSFQRAQAREERLYQLMLVENTKERR